MSFGINIQGGGTHAGWRTVREQGKKPWLCKTCDAWLKYHWVSCPECRHPKPES